MGKEDLVLEVARAISAARDAPAKAGPTWRVEAEAAIRAVTAAWPEEWLINPAPTEPIAAGEDMAAIAEEYKLDPIGDFVRETTTPAPHTELVCKMRKFLPVSAENVLMLEAADAIERLAAEKQIIADRCVHFEYALNDANAEIAALASHLDRANQLDVQRVTEIEMVRAVNRQVFPLQDEIERLKGQVSAYRRQARELKADGDGLWQVIVARDAQIQNLKGEIQTLKCLGAPQCH